MKKKKSSPYEHFFDLSLITSFLIFAIRFRVDDSKVEGSGFKFLIPLNSDGISQKMLNF